MIGPYLWLKLVHVIGACVLLGTGLGIAFFMWMAHRTADAGVIASTARIVVIADTVFTASAAINPAADRCGARAGDGFPAARTLDRLVVGSLSVRQRVLAAGGVDTGETAQSRV